jgi:CotH kinase protein
MGDPLVVGIDPSRPEAKDVIPPLVVPVMLITTDNPVDPKDRGQKCPGEWRAVGGEVQIIEEHFGREDPNSGLLYEKFLRDLFPITLDTRVKIKVRGSSSQNFPKNSYSLDIETPDKAGKPITSVLGMPYVEDWVLYSYYADLTCLRNFLTYSIARDLMPYAPRARFVELFVNGDYKGLYVLVEKIKVDPNRVNITVPAASKDSGDITGGYLFKRDGDDPGWTWQSKVLQPDWVIGGGAVTPPPKWTVVFPKPPDGQQDLDTDTEFKGGDLTRPQKEWLQIYMDTFEAYLKPPETQPSMAYRSLIDLKSWVELYAHPGVGAQRRRIL